MMTYEIVYNYDLRYPVVHFLASDLKTNSCFMEDMNYKFDLRSKLKSRFRHYWDIYAFNDRHGDCLYYSNKDFTLYNVIYKWNRNDKMNGEDFITALKCLRDKIKEHGEKVINCCLPFSCVTEQDDNAILFMTGVISILSDLDIEIRFIMDDKNAAILGEKIQCQIESYLFLNKESVKDV